MATKNLFLHSPSAGDIDEIYKEGAESISRLSLPSFPGVHSRNTHSAPSTGSGFEAAVSRVLAHEGGFTASDGNTGAPANFGINQKHNPDVDVRNITQDDAKEIYRNRYWDAIGGDDLPAELQATALDAAVNQGPANARKWIEQSGGDVQKFNALRRQHYEALAAKPEYARFRNTWLRRLASYEQEAQGAGDPAALQAELDREEPGRYRVLSEDEAHRFELQALLDAEEPGRFKVLSDEELAQLQGDTPQAEAPDAAAIPGAASGTTPEEVGFWDRIPQVAKSGWQNMTRALDVSRAVLSDDFSPQTVDLLASTIEQQIKEAQDDKGRQHESERALKDAIEQFGKTEGALDTTTGLFSLLGTVFANPKGVAIGTVEQLANMLPSMGGAAAGAAAGAGVGAAAGSVVPGAGTAAGAGIGALWGSRAGLAAGTAALEFGHEITEAITSRLQDQGKAPTRDNIAALLADPAMQSEIKTQAAKKGLTLAAVDALTMGIASKIGSKGVEAAKAGNRGQAMRYGAGAIGIEAAGEPVGEAASQLVARGEIDKADVAAEAIYGVPASVGGAAIGTATQTMRDRSGAAAPATPPAAGPVDAATPVPAGAAPSGTTPQQTVEPTATPQPAPAHETAAPSGPITRAMERAVGSAPEDEPSPAGEAPPADLPRVRITAENGEAMTGVAESLAEDGTARVVGDDGQVYVIGPDDGVTIEPIVDEAPAAAPEVAAPETDVGIPISVENQALTEPEPVAHPVSEAPQEAAPAPAERPLTEWPEDELRAQLRAVTQQAKLQGMTDELRALRRTISAEIDRRNQERENERRSAADPVPVPDDRVAGGQLPAQIGADFPAGTPDAQAVPGRGAAGRTEVDGAASGKAVSGAGDAADQQPALSPGLIVRTDGTPFKSEAAARQAMRNRRLAGYRPVQVDGGWALEEVPQHEKPLAGDGLTSYRYRGPYGYAMIGARDHQDALNEVRRSLTEGDATIDNLQVWDGNKYVDVTGPESGGARPQAERAKPPRAAQRASEPREMTEEGRAKDGGPIMPGDTFRTLSGRVTTPYPKQKSERYASQWLIDNAVEEAESRGDDFNARIFRSTSMLRGGTLTDADRESMLMYLFGEQPKVVPSILKPLVSRDTKSASEEKDKPQVSKNTIFTDDAAEKARAILRAKLNQLNSGIDPEVMQAGITLAGYHIERGARTFAAYAKAMIEDMGEAVRPYLKSWYLGAKFDPRTAGMEGLSTAAEVEAFDLDNLDAAADTQAEAEAEPEADTEVVVTPAGREIEVRYKVVEGDSLIPSNLDDGRVNPDYPQELQPRNRGKAASELQITNIAANMNPRLLGESASTTDGAPIVSPDGVVESGNGRTMAIMRAYRRGMGSAKSYRDWLAAQGYDVAGMRAPVLVRERVTPMSQQELIEYTRESNARTTMQMSPEEQARTDADLVPGIIDLYVGGDIANAANRDFVRAFIDDIVPQSEQGDMVTDGGALSIRGRKRIEAALMHAAYGDERLVADLFVDPSAEIKTIGGAMLDAAAQWVKMRRNADPSLDVTPQLVAAVNIVRRAREEDKSVYDVANQIDVFSGATDPVTMDFLSMFFRGDRFNRQRSREAIGDMLHGYAASAEQIQPGPDMFGMEPPGAQDILRTIYEKRQREEATGQQGDIFATRTPSDDGGVAGGGRAGQGPGAQAQDAAPQESGGPVNVPSTRESVERDSGDGGAAQSVVSGPDGNAAGQDAGRPRRTGEGSGQTGRAGLGDQRVPGARPASGRARGDQPVHKPDGEFRPESRPAGDSEPAGSGRDSSQGSAVERERQDAVEADAHAPGTDDLAQRLAAQRKAKNTPTKWGNKASIDAALPLLLPEQREDVLKAENRLADHNGILFTNGTGTGKAQPLDAKILTPRGWVRMGDIKVGDYVISVDGTPTKVIGVYPQGKKPIYRVTFDDGSFTECCDEHLWLTQTLAERRKATENPDWNCAKPKVRELSEIRASLSKRHFIPLVSPVEFQGDVSKNLFPAYTLGVILGDGCLTQGGLRITNPECQVFDRIRSELHPSITMEQVTTKNRCITYALKNAQLGTNEDGTFALGSIRQELERLGLYGVSSSGKFIPVEYLRAKVEDRIALLQGLMDTDGTADARTNSVYFTTVSPALKDGVVELVQSLGGVAKVSEKIPAYTYRGERRTGQKAYTVRITLPNSIEPFSLERKAENLSHRSWGQPRRRIVSVESVGEKEAQCIAVEHPMHLYVTDGYIVTHNTATGLGVAKRFINDGKDNIIVVVPSDKIAADWVKFARMLGVPLKQLEDTKSNGDTGPVVTTYANFGQNETLALRDWDLVIADESHYLSSNENGDATDALNQLRALTGHHAGFHHWVRRRFPKEWGAYRDAMRARSDANGNLDIGPDRYAALEAAEARAREKWAPIEAREREKWDQRWERQEGLPKTVFLSATPFAYAKNTDYAEGYLFHYVEPAQLKNERGSRGYNQGSPRDRFLMQHFGYRMRYNKLTAPEAGVNSELMEQQFNEWLKSQGALSGRRLEVPFDYDRKFVLVDDAVGTKIDEALKFLREADDGRYREIYDAVMQQFDYQRRMYLLESMKARAAVQIIREHMAAGRKVVVFHDFNKGGGFDPFRDAIHVIADEKTRILAREVLSLPMFRIDFSGLNSPIETMRAAFPDALFFNGTVPKKQRRQNADLFNDDNSGRNLIVVQSDAGREGVSLHDTTGKHQRVEINLGMPVKPVAATQIEGRIYRTGQASNAIFRYLTTGTAWEASAFASKIAERASTAENLALGSEARGLKEAFIDAYLNAGEFPVSRDDGKGGKENDRKLSAALTASPFERAKTFYYAQAKNTRRRDQREGIDYFATPEPVGFKMVEWADIRPNDKVLEPSAGHGAIARFFPQLADVTMVEPSYELSQRAGLANGNARIVNDTFESLHINNKYDAIVMNPPYGHGGKTAIEHLAKAAKHLRNGGRIVALLPRGGMADKRLNDFLESEDAANLYRVASVDLPSATFERAGTSVNTRIVVLERQDNPDDAERINDRWIDLSGARSITELFDRIEHVGMPERAAPATPEPRQELVEHITAKGKRLLGVIRTDLTQDEAKAIDPYTFRKKNAEGKTGWFIRSKHLDAAPKFSIAPPTQSEAFKRWFGDSKVVDAEGNPLVVYHGTKHDFTEFQLGVADRRDAGWFGDGFYLTASRELASSYAMRERDYSLTERPANVMPVYVRMSNPYRINLAELSYDEGSNFTKRYGGNKGFQKWLADNGYDGVIGYRDPEIAGQGAEFWEVVVFDPAQIKSAIGNIGTYDPSNPDIRYSLVPGADRNQEVPVASAPLLDADPQSLFSTARDWYRANLLGTSVENPSLNAAVHFSHSGMGKALSVGRRNRLRMSAVQALPDLVRNAVVVEESPDRKGRDFIDGYATLVAPVEIDGDVYAVSMKVRRAHGRDVFYTFQAFNIEKASDGGGWQLTPTGDSHSTAALQNDGDAAAVSMPGAAAAPSPDINVAASRASAPRNLQESHSTASQSEAGSSGVRPDSRPGDPLARRRTLTVGELLDAMNDGNRAFSVDASPVYDGILWNDEDNGNIINVKDLRNALVSGRIGGAVAAMIDAGRVVLHDTASSVPVPNMPAGVQAVTMPDGTIHMVADALTRENAQAVLLHEAFHNGGEKLIGSEAWGELLKRLGSIHRQAKQSSGRAREFYDAARRSVARAQRAGVQMGEDLTAEEFGAYTIEHYDQAPPAFRKWVDDVIGAIKAWLLRRFGIQAGAVTPAQLRALAVAALRNEALAADASRFSVAPPTNSPAFRRWFGDSKVVDANGEPLVVYHGTNADFSVFDRDFLGEHTGQNTDAKSAMNMAGLGFWFADSDVSGRARYYASYPVYLSVKNPRVFRTFDSMWNAASKFRNGERWKESLEAAGYDGVIVQNDTEFGVRSFVAFRPEQIKSAIGNIGTYDPNNPDIRYSLKPSKHFKDLTDKQKSFLDKIGPERLPQRLSDRWRQLTDNLALRIRQAGVDRYAALLRNDQALYGEDTLEGSIASSAWVLARMSHAAGGALAAMIDYGRIYLDPKEKVIDVREGTTGLRQMFQQLGSPQEIDRFMAWVAANRARKLMAEGRENLFTEEEIDAGINLSAGRMEDGRNRGMVYAKAWKEFQQFRDDVLAIAEQSGTISPEQRALWSQEFYVPFYRVLDDDSIGGPSASSGLSRQQAYKRLKGGKQNLNDLLENTLLNFHHLIQSSLKNQAARQAVENAETLGIAHPTTESKRNKKASTFVMVDGQKQWYDIEDPLTFKALSALNTTGLNTPLMKVGRAFKRLFTNMTTITPQFMIANTLRDSLSAMATSPTSAVPLKNAIKGAAVYGNDRNRARMLASGASFSFGHVYGQTADEIKASLRGTLRKARVISDPKLVPGALLGAWRKWNQITDFAENVNRAGIWERNQGRGKLKAAFEARDLMDFSAHGDSLTVRIMIDLVPFLNARIQGLDKLYRSGFKPGGKVLFGKGTKADKAAFGRFAAVVGALSLVSMMLYLNNKDDEEYRKLEDWQRDTYWFFRFGENAFFIPKPFEVGAIATLAERALEQFMDPTVAGKKFGERMGHMLTDTFALDLPQIIKPAYELATNRNTFTGRPIEDMGMQRLSPSLRVKPGTSKLAEGMSRAMESVAGDAALSPLQIDHLIGAYLGQVGAGTVALADVFWRRVLGEELPARRWSEYQPIRRFYRDLGAPAPYTRYSTDFYEALKEADKAYANVQHLLKYQEFERADKLTEKEADKLEMRRWLNKVQSDLSKINAEMRRIQMDKEMSGEEKRYQLDRLRELRNMITEEVGKELEQDRVRRRGQQ